MKTIVRISRNVGDLFLVPDGAIHDLQPISSAEFFSVFFMTGSALVLIAIAFRIIAR